MATCCAPTTSPTRPSAPQVRTPEWQAHILAMPLAARRAFAAKARADSKAHTGSTMESIMDVNADAVARSHAHRQREPADPRPHAPARDARTHARRSAPPQRIVLGDWYEHGSVLRVTPDAVDLRGLAVG